jgi:hypothetical protein
VGGRSHADDLIWNSGIQEKDKEDGVLESKPTLLMVRGIDEKLIMMPDVAFAAFT